MTPRDPDGDGDDGDGDDHARGDAEELSGWECATVTVGVLISVTVFAIGVYAIVRWLT